VRWVRGEHRPDHEPGGHWEAAAQAFDKGGRLLDRRPGRRAPADL